MKLRNYYEHTPRRFRKLGDAFIAASTMITTYAIVEEMKVFAVSALVLGVIGKFLTNLFNED